jgi:hypothetical protein
MEDQLSLWPEQKSPEPDIWENLTPETKNAVITVLSKLISKAASPITEENSHER